MTRHIKEDEQSKEAELVRLRTPLRTIRIDWMTGQICAPEPIEHSGHVIPFTRRAAACAGKANSHVVVKDTDVHSLDELRAARRAAVVRDDDDDEGEDR